MRLLSLAERASERWVLLRSARELLQLCDLDTRVSCPDGVCSEARDRIEVVNNGRALTRFLPEHRDPLPVRRRRAPPPAVRHEADRCSAARRRRRAVSAHRTVDRSMQKKGHANGRYTTPGASAIARAMLNRCRPSRMVLGRTSCVRGCVQSLRVCVCMLAGGFKGSPKERCAKKGSRGRGEGGERSQGGGSGDIQRGYHSRRGASGDDEGEGGTHARPWTVLSILVA